MDFFLPKEIQHELDAARKAALSRTSRLRIQVGEKVFPVLRSWQGGFALDAETSPALRGRVELYEGARHLSQCLIVASEEGDGEIRFEYKRMTEAADVQPLDFYRPPLTPVALLDAPEGH